MSKIKLGSKKRAEKFENSDPNRAECGIITDRGHMWATSVRIGDAQWRLYDFGDSLPLVQDENQLIDEHHGFIADKNQRLLIHTASGIVCIKEPIWRKTRASVQKISSSFRTQVYLQGEERFGAIGELPSTTPHTTR